MTFQDYKRKVSIIEAALALGYKFNKADGRTRPTFILRDQYGNKIDSIIITNPNNSEQQGYFRHNGTKGDLITFLKENINGFPVSGRNEIDTINKILERLSGIENSDYTKYVDEQKNKINNNFDINRYSVEKADDNINIIMPYFKLRGISETTVDAFATYINRVLDTEAKYKYKNLGFPYTKPGSKQVEGFEVRGFNKFKGKAEGTNSSSALWIADFSDNPLDVNNVYFAESGYDIMSFYQANKEKLDLKKSVFCSLGGSFSDKQILNTMEYYRYAKAVDCFDNDLAGRVYGCRMAALVDGKTLNVTTDGNKAINLTINGKELNVKEEDINLTKLGKYINQKNNSSQWHAPKNFKDWNDYLKDTPIVANVEKKNRFQLNEKLENNRKFKL